MTKTRKFWRLMLVPCFIGLTFSAVSNLVVIGEKRRSSVGDASRGRMVFSKDPIMDCRLGFLSDVRRKTELASLPVFQEHPELLTEPALRNPLIGDPLEAEVRNISKSPIHVVPWDGHAFSITHEMIDAAGEPIVWDKPTLHSLKRLGRIPGGAASIAFRPEHRERRTLGLIGFGVADGDVQPGRYTVRAVATYTPAKEVADRRIESESIVIDVTLENIRQWQFLNHVSEEEIGLNIPPRKTNKSSERTK